MEEIIDEVILTTSKPHEMMTKTVEKLVEAIPIDFLMEETSLEVICKKVEGSIDKDELKLEELKKSIESIPSQYKEEMQEILNAILDRVFGSGIDYLYVVKY